MNEIAQRDRTARAAARRFGYLVAAAINAVLLYLIHVSPGWETVPFLTDATVDVLGIVSATMIAAIIVNLVYVGWDPPAVRAVGEMVTTAIGLASAVRVWQVFPFDFSDYTVNWGLVARVVLVVAVVGSIIALITHVIALLRALR